MQYGQLVQWYGRNQHHICIQFLLNVYNSLFFYCYALTQIYGGQIYLSDEKVEDNVKLNKPEFFISSIKFE